MKLQLSVAIAALSMLPLSAWAAGKVVLDVGSPGTDEQGSMEFEFDGSRMRMNLPASAGAQTYMILRDGKVYTVMSQGGQPLVMDLSAVGQMLGDSMGQNLNVGSEANGLFSLEDTGRSETVAGIQGRVYVASYTDSDGRTQTDEVVIGNHPQLREFSQSMALWGRAVAESFGGASAAGSSDESMQLVLGQGDGILRFGDSYRVSAVSNASIISSRFELPANAQQMLNLGGLVPGQDNETAPVNEGGRLGGILGGLLGGQAERQTDRQQERAESRAEREVDGAVDRAFDRALDGIFGR
ncbi:MAG TPA: hypothetical protein VNR18_01085 [Hyphomicrobiales bacterium]|nr:hypothetical protein [Hyphomicrobiales bacterium]